MHALSKCVHPVSVTALFLVASSSAGGQQLIRVLDQDYWPDGLDNPLPRLELLEDLDGDGLGEFVIGDDGFDPDGKVSVVSSISGQELVVHSLPPRDVWDAANVGDVNGDGTDDYGSASILHPGGGMWIWSGRDFSLLYQDPSPIPASLTVAGIGDVNGDGLQDVAYARGGIRVIAGGSFEELYVAVPDAPAYIFGWRIVSLGDVNGDRVPDFAVSAPNSFIFNDACVRAWIFVFSGLDGRQLYRIQGAAPCDFLGLSLAAPGDVTGDGVVDLAATSDSKCVRFFDGRNGALVAEACNEHDLTLFGYVMEAVGDINANGFGDVLVYGINHEYPPPIGRGGIGEAWLLDGGTREYLYRITEPRPFNMRHIYAYAFTACGDWNDDGQPDFAIAAPTFDPAKRGLIDIISGHPFGVRSLEEACPRAEDGPRIGSSGIPALGSKYRVHLSQVTPGTRGLLVVGTALLEPSKGSAGGLGAGGGRSNCGLRVRPDHVIPAIATPAGGKNAAATAALKIGSDLALVDRRLYAQWIIPKKGGRTVTSRVLEITIQAGLPPP